MGAIGMAMILSGAVGAVSGLTLAYASRKMAVETDPRLEQIMAILPGANCGGCGFPGCMGLAKAIVSGAVAADGCPVGKNACAGQIAAIMGVKIDGEAKTKIAVIFCQGGKTERADRFYYFGVSDCVAAQMLQGGYKVCESGCLGLGNCVRACKFQALRINNNELPEVDPTRCTGCGACVKACPRHLIELVNEAGRVAALCRNHDTGAAVKRACRVGCIGCGACVRNCPEQAIVLTDHLPVIDSAKCIACGKCAGSCPVRSIRIREITVK